MDERGQFTFYRSFWEAVKGLPKKDKLPILEAIIAYALDGIEPSGLSQSQFAFFLLVKPTLDSSRKKAANGKQAKNKPKANRKQTESKTQSNDKQTVNEKEKEYEIENEIEIERENEKDKEQTDSAPFCGKLFTSFWEEYPKKIDREGAWEAWKTLAPSVDTAAQIMSALAVWKQSSQWTQDGDRFIPNAAKFLTQKHWESPPKPGVGKNTTQWGSCTLGEAELEAIQRVLREG